jgi:hypothetical protein
MEKVFENREKNQSVNKNPLYNGIKNKKNKKNKKK